MEPEEEGVDGPAQPVGVLGRLRRCAQISHVIKQMSYVSHITTIAAYVTEGPWTTPPAARGGARGRGRGAQRPRGRAGIRPGR